MSKALSAIIVCVLLCAPAGCRKKERPPPTREAAEPAHQHMQAHFDAIVRIRDALIAGDIKSAKTAAQWIIDNDQDPGIEAWRESVAEIRQWSRDMVRASKIETAAAAGAELARACGRCHAANGVSPDLGAAKLPPKAPGLVPDMQRHNWAAERMWEGLIGPSESRWNAGIAELAKAPLTSDTIVATKSADPSIAELAQQVNALGEEARGIPATAWDTRGAIYARYLSTCAACHQALRPERR